MIYQYVCKFYLNASHFIYIKDHKGEPHSHCFEFVVDIGTKDKTSFVSFTDIERSIESILKPYQEQLLNEIEPFDTINPTLENIAGYFETVFIQELTEKGWVLLTLEVSETPTRSYLISVVADVVENMVEGNIELKSTSILPVKHNDKNVELQDGEVVEVIESVDVRTNEVVEMPKEDEENIEGADSDNTTEIMENTNNKPKVNSFFALMEGMSTSESKNTKVDTISTKPLDSDIKEESTSTPNIEGSLKEETKPIKKPQIDLSEDIMIRGDYYSVMSQLSGVDVNPDYYKPIEHVAVAKDYNSVMNQLSDDNQDVIESVEDISINYLNVKPAPIISSSLKAKTEDSSKEIEQEKEPVLSSYDKTMALLSGLTTGDDSAKINKSEIEEVEVEVEEVEEEETLQERLERLIEEEAQSKETEEATVEEIVEDEIDYYEGVTSEPLKDVVSNEDKLQELPKEISVALEEDEVGLDLETSTETVIATNDSVDVADLVDSIESEEDVIMEEYIEPVETIEETESTFSSSAYIETATDEFTETEEPTEIEEDDVVLEEYIEPEYEEPVEQTVTNNTEELNVVDLTTPKIDSTAETKLNTERPIIQEDEGVEESDFSYLEELGYFTRGLKKAETKEDTEEYVIEEIVEIEDDTVAEDFEEEYVEEYILNETSNSWEDNVIDITKLNDEVVVRKRLAIDVIDKSTGEQYTIYKTIDTDDRTKDEDKVEKDIAMSKRTIGRIVVPESMLSAKYED